MVGRRILYILSLAGCLVFYCAYQKWFSWIVLLAMVLLPWFSLLLSLRAMLGTQLKLIVPERITKGRKAKIRMEIRCPTVRPPLMYRIRVSGLNTGETWILYEGDSLPLDHCGGLMIQSEGAAVCDYLGLFRLKVRKTPVRIVKVMPRSAEMPLPESLNRYLAKAWRPKQGGGYAENHEIRPYHPGDTLNLVHWKLSAKVDSLMLREPMEPDQGLMLLTLDLSGSSDELDRKYSRLLCFGKKILNRGAAFEVIALTGNGLESWLIREDSDLRECIDALFCTPCAKEGSVCGRKFSASLQLHIGGEPDEE